MESVNYIKQADKVAKRLGNYECEGQMSIFDVDWDSICKEAKQNNKREIDEMELDFPF